jgi:uncharacterized protein (TIGR02271 family)
MRSDSETAAPLEGTPARSETGWRVHLPVRAEEVMIGKQTVVRERVVVNRKWVQGVERVDAVLRREQLHTATSGGRMPMKAPDRVERESSDTGISTRT